MALLYGGRKHVEHGSMQPRRSSAQRLSHTQSPPGSAAHSPEQHRSRRNAGWISLGACLVVAWGAPADTAHPLAPPRAHDWRAPRHVPSHPPPWQKGPGLRRMTGNATFDTRFHSPFFQKPGENDTWPMFGEEVEVPAGYELDMSTNEGNVSHIDPEVAHFTPAELKMFRPPGGGAIDKLSDADLARAKQEAEDNPHGPCPFGEDETGLDPAMRFHYFRPSGPDKNLKCREVDRPDPWRVPRMIEEQMSHHRTQQIKILRQVAEFASFSGHDTRNVRGHCEIEPDVLKGQVPEWDARAKVDERMRVFDNRLCAKFNYTKEPWRPTEDIFHAARPAAIALRKAGYRVPDELVGAVPGPGEAAWGTGGETQGRDVAELMEKEDGVALEGDMGLVSDSDWVADDTREMPLGAKGAAGAGLEEAYERPWAIDSFGHLLYRPNYPNGTQVDDALTSGDYSEEDPPPWRTRETLPSPEEDAAARAKRKAAKHRYIRQAEAQKWARWRVLDELERRSRRKLMAQVRREAYASGEAVFDGARRTEGGVGDSG
ncbi:hypothetical protein T484DRAFT_1911703, partial [Baffinella frigidus]